MNNLRLKDAFDIARHKYYYKNGNYYIIEKNKEYFCRVKTEEDARRLTHCLKQIGFETKNLPLAFELTNIKPLKKNCNTGFYKTSKVVNEHYKKGYSYVYVYYENDKKRVLKSTTLPKIRQKVLDKGLEWKPITDEAKKMEVDYENRIGEY